MTSRTSSLGRFLGIFAFFLALIVLPQAFGQGLNPNPPASPVKLIFIHHSTGEGWLVDDTGQLALELMDNNYFVSDTNYGWGPDSIGDRTDIGNWHDWYLSSSRDTYLAALYAESDEHSSYTRMADDPGGTNEIIMFKSCFPNSNISGNPGDAPLAKGLENLLYGQDCYSEYHTVANIKGLYRDLLDYFSTRQDKLFILIVSPPLIQAETTAGQAANARAVANWLINDWLDSYAYSNVKTFDYFNVLTSNGGSRTINDLNKSAGNHHRYWNSAIQHIQTVASNYSAYGSGDSHPTAAGHRKATGEFVPLLNIWYNAWKEIPGPSLTVTAPASGDTWYRGEAVSIAWTKSGTQGANVKIQLYKGATKVKDISLNTPNDEGFTWTVPPTISMAANYRIRITTLDGLVRGDSELFAIAKPTIVVSAPAKSAVWPKGSARTIVWTANGPQNAYVKIELLRSGVKVLNINLSVSNSGSYGWTVPTSLPTSAAYKVRVRTVDNLVTGLSQAFTIS